MSGGGAYSSREGNRETIMLFNRPGRPHALEIAEQHAETRREVIVSLEPDPAEHGTSPRKYRWIVIYERAEAAEARALAAELEKLNLTTLNAHVIAKTIAFLKQIGENNDGR